MKTENKPQTIQQQPVTPKPSENNVFYQLHLYFKEKHFLDGPRNLQIKEFGRLIKTLSFANSSAEKLSEEAQSLYQTFHHPLYESTSHTTYYRLREDIIAMAKGEESQLRVVKWTRDWKKTEEQNKSELKQQLFNEFIEYNNWISNKQPKKPTFFTRHTNFEIKIEIDNAVVDKDHKPEHGGCYQM